MGKKLIYIILGALIVFGLLFLAWSWFFGGSAGIQTSTTGTFGAASSTNQNLPSGSGASSGNGQTPLGGTTANGTITINNGASNGGGAANASTGSSTQPTLANLGNSTTGATWLGGTGSASAGSGSAFNPTAINSLNGGAGGSAPTIFNANSSSGSGLNLGTALLGAGVAGAISCGIRGAAIGAAGITGGAVGVTTATGVFASGVPVGGVPLALIAGNSNAQTALQGGDQSTSFAGCIINTLAKVALQQITISVVNWINSGFNGQPAFVTNYNQFFTNVADAAAGQFIQGTGLAFLCSPFQLQIKIAIAQAYANRNAQSCTLSGIIKNVNNFMNGAFSQGGWGGFVSFTTVPTNNPYGAFAYAQVGLGNAQSAAAANAKNNISPTGFLNLQQLSGCTDPSQNGISGGAIAGTNPQAAIAGGASALPPGCKAKVITPGGAIADSLGAVNKSGVDQLGIGNDLDQIINALTTQLITKTLYSGLSSLSTQSTVDTASQSQDAALLADMQNNISLAQQYGSIEQGSIGDIENAQEALNTLANCWGTAASSTSLSSAQTSTAAQNAASASAQLQSYDAQINLYNNNITNTNNEIAELEQFITEATTVGSAADVQALAANYSAAQAAQPFITQTDVTTEQQNRATLQLQLQSVNQSTASSQTQCNAFGQ